MKSKFYELQSDGSLRKVKVRSFEGVCVEATSESDARKLLLARFAKAVELGGPVLLRGKQDARSDESFQLIRYCPITDGFLSDCGNRWSNGEFFPLCTSGHLTIQSAKGDSSQAYYNSSDFLREDCCSVVS